VLAKHGYTDTPLEIKRTEYGKVFDLGNGQKHLSQSIAPIHYQDETGEWQEIDLSIRFDEDRDAFVMDKAAYTLEALTTGVGWRHVSRRGGWMQCELMDIDGKLVEYKGSHRVIDNQLFYDGVIPGIDMKIVAYPHKSEVFKKLTEPGQTLRWRITKSDDFKGVFNPKTAGWNKRTERLELKTSFDGEVFTERWTGRVSQIADPRTRRKKWVQATDMPVFVDAAINEEVAAAIDAVYQLTDGTFQGFYSNTYVNVSFAATNEKKTGGVRFRAIGIGAGATVSAAVLTGLLNNWYGGSNTPKANIIFIRPCAGKTRRYAAMG